MSKTILLVQGMSCPSCIEQLNEALSIQGVSSVDVQLDEGVVAIDHDVTVSAHRLIASVQQLGYDATLQMPS